MKEELLRRKYGEKMWRRKNRKRSSTITAGGVTRWAFTGLNLSCVTLLCVVIVAIWCYRCEQKAHIAVKAERVNIEAILEKEVWTEADYEVLQNQTGLAPVALNALAEQGRKEEIPDLQETYFTPIKVRCEPNTIFSREEYVADEAGNPVSGMTIPYVENGDILITFCSHFFGWRNGHAAIVIDEKAGLVLEAQVLGAPSVVTTLKRWERYPSFMVLRLKDVSKEERAAVAEYAKDNLAGVPYRLTAGLWGRGSETLSGTQCAHLVWYSYAHFGYDLDSDGGLLVTPYDLSRSENLEIIQKYGS